MDCGLRINLKGHRGSSAEPEPAWRHHQSPAYHCSLLRPSPPSSASGLSSLPGTRVEFLLAAVQTGLASDVSAVLLIHLQTHDSPFVIRTTPHTVRLCPRISPRPCTFGLCCTFLPTLTTFGRLPIHLAAKQPEKRSSVKTPTPPKASPTYLPGPPADSSSESSTP